MKDFGNKNSWTFLVKIDVEVLQTQVVPSLKPLCIHGRFLVFYQLTLYYQMHVILYDLRGGEVAQRIGSTKVFFEEECCWIYFIVNIEVVSSSHSKVHSTTSFFMYQN